MTHHSASARIRRYWPGISLKAGLGFAGAVAEAMYRAAIFHDESTQYRPWHPISGGRISVQSRGGRWAPHPGLWARFRARKALRRLREATSQMECAAANRNA